MIDDPDMIDMALPQSLLNYLQQDNYDSGAIPVDISATKLKDSPRVSRLWSMHKDKIKVPFLNKGYAKLGEAWHTAMEASAPEDWICEKRFYADVDGKIISGAIDALEPAGKNTYNIIDYKMMSTYKAQTDLNEFENQLNIYAFLLRQNGYKVDGLFVSAVLRDWTQNKIKQEGYPRTQFPVFVMEKWSDKVAEDYVRQRIKYHTSEEIPLCTDEERWMSAPKYAVISDKTKATLKLYDTYESAQAHVSKSKFYVEKREAEPIRCKRFCEVAPYCDQYQASLVAEELTKEG